MKKNLLLLACISHSALFAVVSQRDLQYRAIQRANRRVNAKEVREAATAERARQSIAPQLNNGDEDLYPDKRGSYAKGLPHLDSGLVDPAAFNKLVIALQKGTSDAFLDIPMGTPGAKKFHSPQAAFQFNLIGADGWSHSVNPAPKITSAEKAGELVELYCMRLLYDIDFDAYATLPGLVIARLADLNALSDFRGPKIDGQVTAQTLFRGNLPGVLDGPYISQFLLMSPMFSDTPFVQRYTVPTAIPGNAFMTTVADWLASQRGNNPATASPTFDPTLRYIRNARDLANFVHRDPPQLPYIYALYILFSFAAANPAALDAGSPYIGNPTQEAFAEFFVPQFMSWITYAGEAALKAAWYNKWVVNRTIRPEFFAYLVHQQITGALDSGIHPDVINSAATAAINTAFGTYLLPQAYTEGAPMHPSYPAGHATVAGACVTMLKAFFNEDFVIPNPVVQGAAGTTLVAAPVGTTLTIGGELNKLGSNVATGRNMAGVHYRCDAEESMRLGEAVAISILEDIAYTINVNFGGWTLTKFDGTKITIGGKKRIGRLP